MTTQPGQRADSEVFHVAIRIDLTGQAADAALIATRLTTALNGLANVDVITARPRRAAHSPWSRTRSCASKPSPGARSYSAARSR
ncbi:MAG TPA: hypothetical protein VGL02_09230 [Streptomyces sp.]